MLVFPRGGSYMFFYRYHPVAETSGCMCREALISVLGLHTSVLKVFRTVLLDL